MIDTKYRAPPVDFLLNQGETRAAHLETVATKGKGVGDGLNLICKMVMADFVKEHEMSLADLAEKNGS